MLWSLREYFFTDFLDTVFGQKIQYLIVFFSSIGKKYIVVGMLHLFFIFIDLQSNFLYFFWLKFVLIFILIGYIFCFMFQNVKETAENLYDVVAWFIKNYKITLFSFDKTILINDIFEKEGMMRSNHCYPGGSESTNMDVIRRFWQI